MVCGAVHWFNNKFKKPVFSANLACDYIPLLYTVYDLV